VREQGDRYALARDLSDLGLATSRLGQGHRASAFLREAIGLFRELGNVGGIGQALRRLAELSAAGGDARRAARLLGAAQATDASVSAATPTWTTTDADRIERRLRTELGVETFEASRAEGRSMSPDQAIAYALDATEAA
jgi:hypothetical protein